MAHIASGSFFGYRELEAEAAVGRVQLPIWELGGPVPHNMKVYQGEADDDYGEMVSFPWQTIILLVQVWDNNAIFKLSDDGETYQDEREIDPAKNLGSWFRRYAARGIAIKNKETGLTARYQIVPFA